MRTKRLDSGIRIQQRIPEQRGFVTIHRTSRASDFVSPILTHSGLRLDLQACLSLLSLLRTTRAANRSGISSEARVDRTYRVERKDEASVRVCVCVFSPQDEIPGGRSDFSPSVQTDKQMNGAADPLHPRRRPSHMRVLAPLFTLHSTSSLPSHAQRDSPLHDSRPFVPRVSSGDEKIEKSGRENRESA